MVGCGLLATGRGWTKVSPCPAQKMHLSKKHTERCCPNPTFYMDQWLHKNNYDA